MRTLRWKKDDEGSKQAVEIKEGNESEACDFTVSASTRGYLKTISRARVLAFVGEIVPGGHGQLAAQAAAPDQASNKAWLLAKISLSMFETVMKRVAAEAYISKQEDAGEEEGDDMQAPEQRERQAPCLRTQFTQLKSSVRAHNDVRATEQDIQEAASIIQLCDPITGAASCKVPHCKLEHLRLNLLLHGFTYKAAWKIMDMAHAGCADGTLTSEVLGQILHAFKIERARQAEPPSGMGNGIHILVLRGGSPVSILPVLHVLQDRAFPRICQTAMQLGGTLNFEHVSLDGDVVEDDLLQSKPGLEGGFGQNLRLSVADCLSYAEVCASVSAHVWFLFVLDESAASATLPTKVPADAFQEILDLATEAGNPCLLIDSLQSLYECRGEYILKSDKRPSTRRAIKVLRENVLAFVYFDDSAETSAASTQEPIQRSHTDQNCEALRQALVEHFLQPTSAFKCMQQASLVSPTFVILLENVCNSHGASLQRLENGLKSVEEGNILRYKYLPSQKTTESHNATFLPTKSVPEVHGLSRTSSFYKSYSERRSSFSLSSVRRHTYRPSALVGQREKQDTQVEDNKARWQADQGADEDVFSIQDFLLSYLHRNVNDLFFDLISSTIADCPFLSEHQAHDRVLKGLLHEVDVSSGKRFEHGGQKMIILNLRDYLADLNDARLSMKKDFRELQALKAMVLRKYREHRERTMKKINAAGFYPPKDDLFWSTDVPSGREGGEKVVKMKMILDNKEARDEMASKYSSLRRGLIDALDKEFLDLPVSERLALVQVLHGMGTEGRRLMEGIELFCPEASPQKDAALLLVAEPGSGCSTAIALALRDSKRLQQNTDDSGLEAIVFDSIIPGVVILRFVCKTSCASDGQSLLRWALMSWFMRADATCIVYHESTVFEFRMLKQFVS